MLTGLAWRIGGGLAVLVAVWFLWHQLTGHYIAIGEALANEAMQVKVDEQRAAKEAAERQANDNRIQAEKYHDQLVAAGTDNYRAIAGSLRDIKATVGSLDLSRSMENSGLAGDPSAVAGAVAEFKAAVVAFTDGVDRVAVTCTADATGLAGILDLAQRNGAIEGR